MMATDLSWSVTEGAQQIEHEHDDDHEHDPPNFDIQD
jgi:hypothetical protein